jgi:hypothetical protein
MAQETHRKRVRRGSKLVPGNHMQQVQLILGADEVLQQPPERSSKCKLLTAPRLPARQATYSNDLWDASLSSQGNRYWAIWALCWQRCGGQDQRLRSVYCSHRVCPRYCAAALQTAQPTLLHGETIMQDGL